MSRILWRYLLAHILLICRVKKNRKTAIYSSLYTYCRELETSWYIEVLHLFSWFAPSDIRQLATHATNWKFLFTKIAFPWSKEKTILRRWKRLHLTLRISINTDWVLLFLYFYTAVLKNVMDPMHRANKVICHMYPVLNCNVVG